MDIFVNNNYSAVAHNAKDVEIFWDNLNKKIQQDRLIIKEIYIDGTIFQSDHNIIINNMDSINRLDILLYSIQEACTELTGSLLNYLNNIIPHMEDIANEFYGGPTESTWKKFQQLIEGIEWVISAGNSLSINLKNNEPYSFIIQEFKKILINIMDAFKEKDYYTVGDLLQYDTVDLINNVLEQHDQAGTLMGD